MSKVDAETIINLPAGSDTANIYSTDPVWMKKIEKLGGKSCGAGKEIDVPRKWIVVQQG